MIVLFSEPANNKEGQATAVARQYYEEQQLESQKLTLPTQMINKLF